MLRLALLASLLLALEGYLVAAGYACPSLACGAGAYWMILGLWLGAHLGLLLRCRLGRLPFAAVAFLLGYGGILLAVTLVSGWVIPSVLALACLAVDISLVLLGIQCGLVSLATLILSYQVFVSMLLGLTPPLAGLTPISLLTGLLTEVLYVDSWVAIATRRARWLVPMALGFAFLIIAGFTAAYVSMAYSMASKGVEQGVSCGWSVHCVRVNGQHVIPLPSWLYTVAVFLHLTYTGVLMALPPAPHRLSESRAQELR